MVDGPFGSASEDFLNYETVLLVGAGIGVTPFASILKSIWYRMNNFNNSKPTRLSKVYFTWVIRDFGSAEWFHSLLHAIEEQDTQNRIEINIYLTAKIREEDMNNIIVQDVGAEKDAITSLRAPTHFGRPNWDRVFSSIAEKHPETDVGVFFCGPAVLSRQLHHMSNKYSSPKGTKFFFGKGASWSCSLSSSSSVFFVWCVPVADGPLCALLQRTSKGRPLAPGVGGAFVVGFCCCRFSMSLLLELYDLSLSLVCCIYIYLVPALSRSCSAAAHRRRLQSSVHVEYNIQPTPSLLLSPSPSLSRNLDTDTLIHCRSALRLACASRLHASFRFTLPASACLGSVLLVIVYIRLA